MAINLSTGLMLDGDVAESLITNAALNGHDWIGAGGQVDAMDAARLQDQCRAELEDRFVQFREAHRREDGDRIRLMVKSLKSHLQSKTQKTHERIALYQNSGNSKRMKMIPAESGRLNKETLRVEQRIAELRHRAEVKAQDGTVSSGVVRII
jgi:hypothetical protein